MVCFLLKPDSVSVPELMAAATRSGTDLFSRPQARESMMPVSEFTLPLKPSLPRSRSVTICLEKAMPTCSYLTPS
ncbi:hypothetical protein D3C78_1515130 [compost metagenome]